MGIERYNHHYHDNRRRDDDFDFIFKDTTWMIEFLLRSCDDERDVRYN